MPTILSTYNEIRDQIIVRWYFRKLCNLGTIEIKRKLFKAGFRPKIDDNVWKYDLGHSVKLTITHRKKQEKK